MLGKLIKHDFRALSRILLPVQLAVFGATVRICLGVSFNIRTTADAQYSGIILQLLKIAIQFVTLISVLSIVAAGILTLVVIVVRFYKNLLGDEGYLTFTLPTTATQLLWAKLISAFLWTLISGVVIVVCVNIFLIFGLTEKGMVNTQYFAFFGEAFRYLSQNLTGDMVVLLLEAVALIVLTVVFNLLQIYTALLLGSAASAKHKLLAGIGFYFLINVAVGVVYSMGQFAIVGRYALNGMDGGQLGMSGSGFASGMNWIMSFTQPFFWFYFVLTLAFCVGAFLLCRYLMKNKLNLE